MNSQQQPDNLDLENDGNSRKLIRVITLSQGAFSLILLRCNYTFFQEQIFSKLQEVETVKKIHLLPNIKTIYTNIADQLTYQLDHQPPSALMVFGLESVSNIDAVLTATNQAREEFRNNFNFPVFFWVNDAILRKIIRLAPDFKNWATTIEFQPPSHQLINFIQQETDKIFDGDITNLLFAHFCQELAIAKQDLEQSGEKLDPAINASLEYVFGYRDYLDDNLDSALQHYQQSLNFWQESENLDKQSKIFVKIGLIYYRKASINQTDNQNSLEQAKNYFQQSLEIFKRAENQDSLSQYITLLCEIYLKLQAWDKLEELVNESLKIHQQQNNYLLFLAKDYGFLAELALYKANFQEAKNHAETALQILHDIQSPLPNPLLRGEGTRDNNHKASLLVGERFGERFLHIPKNEQVYYQFLLAKSYHGLGEISKSIEILETAKTNTQIEYNPQLYIDILNQLNLLYFQQEEYLTAFYTKQERLQIEQQYGFRAFVGASYLNPQRKIIQSVNSDKENTGEIAQEIVASGREEDVKRLRSKIAEDRYRLIVIHGQSGVGKSSILQAGLIPALEQETIKAKQVLPILLRAYTNWLGELAKALNVGTIHELSLRSTDAIIKKLAENSTNNLLTVLIFDQFEEFFFVYQEQTERQAFYDFLRRCLTTNDVKIILSLREDYLHYLLELERKFANEKNTDIVNNTDILSKDIRYYLGNFSPTDATRVFTSLTQRSKYSLQKDLIDKLVEELAGNIGEIRPIELQIVGTQLENEKITTLEKYQEKIRNKEKLVAGFLQDVIQECGQKNRKLAELVLYLLTNENNTRPLKTSAELAEELSLAGFMQKQVGVIHELPLHKNPIYTNEDLDLVLKILVVSGLVLLIQESPENRYQLVHDYLVEVIRQKDNELLQKLVETQKQLQKAEAANQAKEKVEEIFSALGFALRSFNNLNQFLELIPLIATRFTDADGTALFLCKPNGQIRLEQLHWQDSQQRKNIRKALETASSQITLDFVSLTSTESLDNEMHRYLDQDVQIFGTAILVKHTERGWLYVLSRDPDYSWTETRQRLVRLVADQTAVAIENNELAAELTKKEHLDQKLEIGAEIQRRFLSRQCPNIPGLLLAARCKLANGVGGDYYDFIPTNTNNHQLLSDQNTNWGLVIGHMMGKDIPAGLIMTMMRGILRGEVLHGNSPGGILQNLNRVMYAELENSHRYVTMFYSEYHPQTRILCYSNAAHNPPLWWHADTKIVSRLDTLGMLIGLDANSQYEDGQVKLEAGDTIIYYTDGLMDAAYAGGNSFEEDNFITAFSTACKYCQNPQEIVDYLFDKVQEFIGSDRQNTDDMTLVVFKIC